MLQPRPDEIPLPEDEEWWGLRVRRDHVLMVPGGRLTALGFGDAGYRAMLRRPGVAPGRSGVDGKATPQKAAAGPRRRR